MRDGDQSGPLARRRKPVDGDVESYHPRPKRSEFDEFPSDEDIERFSGVTFKCPACGTELYDDTELCWKCGHAIGARVDAGEGVPWWVIAVVLVLAGAIGVLAVL